MATYFCAECGEGFEAAQRRDFCCLECAEEFEDRTGQRVELDHVLAAQLRAEFAEWELCIREHPADLITRIGPAPILPTVRNGRIVYCSADDMTDDELRTIAGEAL